MRRGSKGFTLIEVIVAAFILGVAVAGLVGALGSFSTAQRMMVDRERIERLADIKLQELAATREYLETPDGDFTSEGEPDYSWSAEEEVTGVENLYELRVTVTKGEDSLTVRTLLFSPPAATETEEA